MPVAGKYYRIRCTDGNRYLSSNTNDAGRMLTTLSTDQSNIFYYTNGGLLSYNRGVYIHAESSSNLVKLRDVAKTSTAEFIDGKDNNKPGSYIIYVKNSGAGAGRYIHGQNETTDSGKDKPTNGRYSGYTWWLEEVTELPVTITAAGYASFYAPVAVELPDGVTAHTITYNTELKTATLSEGFTEIPANTGVILAGAEGDYDLKIIDVAEALENENILTGTTAATYIKDDAYVLGYINVDGENVVGFGTAKKNQEDNTSWKNNSHKAYLPKYALPAVAQMSAGFRFEFGGTTAIEKVESRNEKEEIYDLTGRKLECINGAGIYIINGKKVLIK